MNEKVNKINDQSISSTFNCKVESFPKSSSINALRPTDIDVIGAIGDSLTVNNLKKATLIFFIVYRFIYFLKGCQWS